MRTKVLINIVASLSLSVAVGGAQSVAGQDRRAVDFSQSTRPVVQVTDSSTIDFLLYELFLAPLMTPDRLQFIDITRNGFGPDDVLIAYPSAEVFVIPEFVPEAVQAQMSGWEPEVEYRMDSGNMPLQALAGLIADGPEGGKLAEDALLYDLVEAVERSYRDLPVALLFQRDSVGFTFQLWDYNRDAMNYTPRAEFASDSTVSSVLTLLEDVGYVPGQNVVGLGVSLESAGSAVTSVDQTIRAITLVSDQSSRNLAVRTVLLGSYDYDRSGAIDQAREIDAPPCAVWNALGEAFPNYTHDFGFDQADMPYLGAVMLNISARVRTPAFRRISACTRGDEPPETDQSDVEEPADLFELPAPVEDFMGERAAADIVRYATVPRQGTADWARNVRAVLLEHFDGDGSGSLDDPAELRAIPCVVWQAITSTRPGGVDQLDTATLTVLSDALGIAEAQLAVARSRIEPCLGAAEERTTVRLREARSIPRRLPPREIRASVTVPLRGLGRVSDERRRYLPAKTILLAMFDLDLSGAIDQPVELDAIPCEVWSALDVTVPGYAERFGFVSPSNAVPYRGDIVFNISSRLRAPTAQRILACARGEVPPVTSASPEGAQSPGELTIPSELRRFLDLETAAMIVRSTASGQLGSASWAATVNSVLVTHYDLDGSGLLDQADELNEVPCMVWDTIEATFGAPLSDLLLDDRDRFMGGRIGISFDQRMTARSHVLSCRG